MFLLKYKKHVFYSKIYVFNFNNYGWIYMAKGMEYEEDRLRQKEA